MPFGLDPLMVIYSAILLCIASAQDLKTREIDDKIWYAFAIPAAIYLAVSLFLELSLASLRVISVLVSMGLFLALGYLGFYGGADVKALLCIALALPTPPRFPFGLSPKALPIFPLTVFNNAVVSSLVYIPINLYHNALVYRREGNLFANYSVPAWKKAILIVATRKVRLKDISTKPDLMFSERITKDGKREILLWPREASSDSQTLSDESLVFAHYLIPMIVPITVGLILSVTLGDLLMGVLFNIIGNPVI